MGFTLGCLQPIYSVKCNSYSINQYSTNAVDSNDIKPSLSSIPNDPDTQPADNITVAVDPPEMIVYMNIG
jgi:hypothetical protein